MGNIRCAAAEFSLESSSIVTTTPEDIMNIDFSADPTFSWYVVLLALSGIVMLALAAIGGGQSAGERLLNLLFGVGFLGYGVYLGFIFDGGEYMMFFYAFVLPVLMLVKFVRTLLGARQTA